MELSNPQTVHCLGSDQYLAVTCSLALLRHTKETDQQQRVTPTVPERKTEAAAAPIALKTRMKTCAEKLRCQVRERKQIHMEEAVGGRGAAGVSWCLAPSDLLFLRRVHTQTHTQSFVCVSQSPHSIWVCLHLPGAAACGSSACSHLFIQTPAPLSASAQPQGPPQRTFPPPRRCPPEPGMRGGRLTHQRCTALAAGPPSLCWKRVPCCSAAPPSLPGSASPEAPAPPGLPGSTSPEAPAPPSPPGGPRQQSPS